MATRESRPISWTNTGSSAGAPGSPNRSRRSAPWRRRLPTRWRQRSRARHLQVRGAPRARAARRIRAHGSLTCSRGSSCRSAHRVGRNPHCVNCKRPWMPTPGLPRRRPRTLSCSPCPRRTAWIGARCSTGPRPPRIAPRSSRRIRRPSSRRAACCFSCSSPPDLATSELVLRRAVEIDPVNVEARNWLQSALSQMGRVSEAQQVLLATAEIGPA